MEQQQSHDGPSRSHDSQLSELSKKPGAWTQALNGIATGAMLGTAAVLAGFTFQEQIINFFDPPGLQYQIPDGMTAEQAEKAAAHVEMAEMYYRMGFDRGVFFSIQGQERAELKEFLEAITPELTPDTRDWQDIATQQHLGRMLEELNSPAANEQQARALMHLNKYLQTQRLFSQSPTASHSLLDKQAREIFYLIVSCTDQGREACQERLAQIETRVHELGDRKLDEFAAKNLEEMRKSYLKNREVAQKAIASGSMDGSFISSLLPTHPALAAFSEDLLALQECRQEDNRTYYRCEVDGAPSEDWLVEVYDYGGSDFTVTLRNVDDETLFCSGEMSDVYRQVLSGEIAHRLVRVTQEAQVEAAHSEKLKSYDLPEEAEINYVRVFSPSGDPVIASWAHTSMLLGEALQHRYGERVDVAPQLMTDSPTRDLVEFIGEQIEQKGDSQHFIIDLFEHGQEYWVGYQTPMTGADLAYIARKFPRCTFDFCTIACYGGGLQESFRSVAEQDPDLYQRVNLFVHTRPDETNLTAEVPVERGMPIPTRGSLYHFHFIDALLHKPEMTFGEIIEYSDRETKHYAPLDAQSVVDGVLITGITGENDPIYV